MENITSRLVKNFPQWMKINKDPESIGAQFLSVFGLEFSEVEAALDQQLNNQYIGTANLGEVDILYRSHVPVTISQATSISLSGDGNAVERFYELQEFYASDNPHKAIIDYSKQLIYTKQLYNTLVITVDGSQHTLTQTLHHVWNAFDEFGLLLSTPRLHGETNAEYRERLTRVFSHPGSATHSGLQNYIGRQLGIPPHHVKLDAMQPAFVGSLLNEDGSASNQLKDIVRRIGETAPATWRNASWDQVYWMIAEPDMLGLEYLPNIWDVTMDTWTDGNFKSGIGDGADLKVQTPRAEKDEQPFDYFVGLQGAIEDTTEVYVPHSFIYKIQAFGIIPENVAPPEEYHYHISAGEIIPLIFTVTASKAYMQSLVVDYEGGGYSVSPDNSIELIPGNQVTSTDSSNVRLRVTLVTDNSTVSPTLSQLTLYWYNDDATPVLQSTIFNLVVDWEDNESMVGLSILETNQLRLANTEFDETVDTTTDWEERHQQSINISMADDKIRLMGVIE